MTAQRRGTLLAAFLCCVPTALVAQIGQPRAQVDLTAYLGLTQWKGQGQLIGGGLQFESAVSRYAGFYGDVALAAVGTGCGDAPVVAACPSTYWHVIGGIKLYPVSASSPVRPYLGAAVGPMRLGSSARLTRAEAGVLIQAWAPAVVHLGAHHSISFGRTQFGLWGLLAGLRFRL